MRRHFCAETVYMKFEKDSHEATLKLDKSDKTLQYNIFRIHSVKSRSKGQKIVRHGDEVDMQNRKHGQRIFSINKSGSMNN